MKDKFIKVLGLILIIMIIITGLNISYASGVEDLNIGDLNDYDGGNIGGDTKVSEKAGVILGYIQGIGAVLSILMLMIIGIKYMMGSVEEKASYKETLKPYIIGVFLLFTGTLLPSIIYNIVNQISKNI